MTDSSAPQLPVAADGQVAVQRAKAPQLSARDAATTLRQAHVAYVALFDRIRAVEGPYGELSRAVTDARYSPLSLAHHPSREDHRQYDMAIARRRLREMPPAKEAKDLLADCIAASELSFDNNRSRVLVGLLIDGFPNARPHKPEAYFEAVMHELAVAGICPAAVAKACSVIREKATFPPAAAEILKAATEAQSTLHHIVRLLTTACDIRENAADVLEGLEAMGEVPPREQPPHTPPKDLEEAFNFGAPKPRPMFEKPPRQAYADQHQMAAALREHAQRQATAGATSEDGAGLGDDQTQDNR